MRNFGLSHIIASEPFTPDCAGADKLPKGWAQFQNYFVENLLLFPKGKIYIKGRGQKRLIVISSLETMEDGRKYLHVSISYRDKIPDWDTVKMIKELFIGDKKDAFIYFPQKEEYVNIMPYCLHLWSEYESDNVL